MNVRHYSTVIALGALALSGCAAVGERVEKATGLSPRARYILAGDYYGSLPQSPEDAAVIRAMQAVGRDGLPTEGE